MKAYFAFLAAALLGALPAHAATTMIGDTPAIACAKSAQAEQPGANISGPSRRDGLALCNQALAGKLRQEDRTATFVNRGIILSAMGRTAAALADYDAALARDAGLTDAYINRGAALTQAGRFAEARADFDRALAMGTPRAALVHFNRGMAHEKMGDLVAAYRDYRQAQALAPDFKPAGLELARFQVTPQHMARTR